MRPRIGGRRDGPSSPRNTVRDLLGHGSVGMSLRYPHLAPDQRREAVAKLNEKPVLALTMRLQCEGFSAETVIGLLEWSQGLRCILICVISAVENAWISRSKTQEGRFLRLPCAYGDQANPATVGIALI